MCYTCVLWWWCLAVSTCDKMVCSPIEYQWGLSLTRRWRVNMFDRQIMSIEIWFDGVFSSNYSANVDGINDWPEIKHEFRRFSHQYKHYRYHRNENQYYNTIHILFVHWIDAICVHAWGRSKELPALLHSILVASFWVLLHHRRRNRPSHVCTHIMYIEMCGIFYFSFSWIE